MTEKRNRCAFLDAQHNLVVEDREVPVPGADEVVVRIAANGICGSDVHFYREGRLGNFVVTTPYSPGHEASGTIASAGSAVRNLPIGAPVVIEPGVPCGRCEYCRKGKYNLCEQVVFLSAPPIDGTFRDYVKIRADSVHPIPANMPLELGALVEPTAVAVHAVRRALFRPMDTAVIVGAGPIGLLTLQVFKAAGGGRVVCIDAVQERLDFAVRIGADETILAGTADTPLSIADVVFETAGSTRATAGLYRLARAGGCVVQVGWPGDNIVPMDIAALLEKELMYVGVNRYANAFPIAISMIADNRIDVRSLITHRFPLDRIAEAFAFTVANQKSVIKTLVTND